MSMYQWQPMWGQKDLPYNAPLSCRNGNHHPEPRRKHDATTCTGCGIRLGPPVAEIFLDKKWEER